jgi:hypothetical protein
MTLTERLMDFPPLLRRALAVLLVPAAALLGWMLVAEPVIWIAGSQDQWRGSVQATLADDRGHEKVLADFKSRLEALPAAPVWQKFYEVAAGGDGSSLVQQDITSLCSAIGVTTQSVVALRAQSEQGLMKHGVRFTATLTVDQLRSFAATLRNHQKYLRTERLTVDAPQAQPADQNPALTITLDVFGYSRAGPP